MSYQADAMSSPTVTLHADLAIEKMLRHPLRHKILIRTGERPWCPAEIADATGEPLKRVCEQVDVLRKHAPPFLELVEERPGPHGGPPRHFYRSMLRVAIEAAQWESLTRLTQARQTATITEELHKEWIDAINCGTFYSDPNHALMRTALHLDNKGREKVARIMQALQEELPEVELESAERSRQTGEPLKRTVTCLASFRPVE
jgi:hypothetical protein